MAVDENPAKDIENEKLNMEDVEKIPSIGLPSKPNSIAEEVSLSEEVVHESEQPAEVLVPKIEVNVHGKKEEVAVGSSSDSSDSEIDICDALETSEELKQYLKA